MSESAVPRTSALRSEDWWACWIGWFLLLLGFLGLLPALPKFGKWDFGHLSAAFPEGATTVLRLAAVFAAVAAVTGVAGVFLRFDLRRYFTGYAAVFLLASVAQFASKHVFMDRWGISDVLFALVFGLAISNFLRVPGFLAAGRKTELFVKVGLVCMGAEVFFLDLVKAGWISVLQALLVATVVWFITFFICRRLGVEERFSAIIASANSICGVSAAIAAGGVLQGKPKEVSYMVAWVLVCAVVLILVMPPLASALALPDTIAGAWLGGVIDNTGAVVAAGKMLDSERAVKVATVVKMAQNVLIGLAAFLMALWAATSLGRREGEKRPGLGVVWERFPKFVLGFILASLAVTFLVTALKDTAAAKDLGKVCGVGWRNWFFTLCFVSIGLETNFRELVSVGGGRPAIGYWLSQGANLLWTLLIAWLLWSGLLFAVPAM